MYLLDTNLVSELRKVRSGKAQQSVPLLHHPPRTGAGVLLAERRDPTQGALLRHWLQQAVVPAFAGPILAVDAAIALRSAALLVPDPKSFRDGLIAATALHSLVGGHPQPGRLRSHRRAAAQSLAAGVGQISPYGDQRLSTPPTVLLLCLWAWRGLLAAL